MPLDLYLVRCQRNALWAVVPLALFTAFAVTAFRCVPQRQSSFIQLCALLPLAAVLASLAVSLVANASDPLQRCVAVAAAVLTTTVFVVAPFEFASITPDGFWFLSLSGALVGAWSAAAVLIPGRPTPSGRLVWWRLALVAVLVAVLPAASAHWDHMIWGPVLALTAGAPIALVLASARRGSASPPIAWAALFGAAVGLAMDSRTGAGVALWTTEFPVLFALGGAAVHVASRARSLTAVRTLDGEPVRLPRVGGRRAVRATLTIGAAFALGVWAFAARASAHAPWEPADEASTFLTELGGIVPFLAAPPPPGVPAAPAAKPLSETESARNAGGERLFEVAREHISADDWDPSPREGDTDRDGRREFLDPWGNPLVYFESSDYDASANGVIYVRGDGTEVRVAPLIDPKANTFLRPTTFQLFSMGPDGLPNTADDIVFGR